MGTVPAEKLLAEKQVDIYGNTGKYFIVRQMAGYGDC